MRFDQTELEIRYQEIKEVQERSYEHVLESLSEREETFILLK
jgi:hypothetical protein